jgi:hypothetical protein
MGSGPSPVRAARLTLVVMALSPMLSGPRRRAVDMHGAGTAQRLAAAELGPGHAETSRSTHSGGVSPSTSTSWLRR